MGQATELLVEIRKGCHESAERLLPVVYDELRALARKCLARERREHTLQPTALVHEAYVRLVDQSRVDWQGRAHFLAVGASLMRRILVDHARALRRMKRGGGWKRVTLSEGVSPLGERDFDVEALHRVLEELSLLDPLQARIVEMRFFSGMTVQEVALALGVSKRTVEGRWTHAKAWLRKSLSHEGDS